MMREYKRYDEYKDSEIEWIGEIPKEWETNRIKYFAEAIGGYPFNSNLFTNDYNDGFPLLRIRNILDQEIKTYYSGKIIKEAIINNEEILIGMDGDFNICWWNNGKALMNQRVCKMNISKNVNKKFLYYTMRFPLKQINDITYYTTVKHLSLDQVNNIYFAIPSLEEQQQITSFLDQKTAEIDELINKKEILIDYLENYKESVVNEAVTKSKLGNKYINKDGELVDEIEMKDSEVEWLGDVPKYFTLATMRRISRINQGLQIAINDRFEKYVSDGFKYITVKYINSNKKEDLYYINNPSSEVICDQDDILYARTGATGQVVTNVNGVFHNNFFKVAYNKRKIKKEFLFTFLSLDKFREKILLLAGTTTIPDLNHNDFLDMEVLLPPMEIQDEIIDYLDNKTTKIKSLIQKTNESIEKYKEYKKSLIFEAVTGKIDLRDYELEGGEELAEHNNSSETERKRLSAVD